MPFSKFLFYYTYRPFQSPKFCFKSRFDIYASQSFLRSILIFSLCDLVIWKFSLKKKIAATNLSASRWDLYVKVEGILNQRYTNSLPNDDLIEKYVRQLLGKIFLSAKKKSKNEFSVVKGRHIRIRCSIEIESYWWLQFISKGNIHKAKSPRLQTRISSKNEKMHLHKYSLRPDWPLNQRTNPYKTVEYFPCGGPQCLIVSEHFLLFRII